MKVLRELAGLLREVRRTLRDRRRSERRNRSERRFESIEAALWRLKPRRKKSAELSTAAATTAAANGSNGAPAPNAGDGKVDLEALLEASARESAQNMKALELEFGPLTPPGTPTAAGVVTRPAKAAAYCLRCASGGDVGTVCPCPAGPDPDQNGPRAAVSSAA